MKINGIDSFLFKWGSIVIRLSTLLANQCPLGNILRRWHRLAQEPTILVRSRVSIPRPRQTILVNLVLTPPPSPNSAPSEPDCSGFALSSSDSINAVTSMVSRRSTLPTDHLCISVLPSTTEVCLTSNSRSVDALTVLEINSKFDVMESSNTTSSRGLSEVLLKVSNISCCPTSGPGKMDFPVLISLLLVITSIAGILRIL